jgi:hypothetical protein
VVPPGAALDSRNALPQPRDGTELESKAVDMGMNKFDGLERGWSAVAVAAPAFRNLCLGSGGPV